jgi:hypothetical protein
MHTVVVRASTVIGRNVTTKVAFILDIGFLMLLTESYTILVVLVLTEKLTLGTLKIVWVIIGKKTTSKEATSSCCGCLLLLLLFESLDVSIITTDFESTKVGVLASVALIIV